ncbi:hypothetical protein FS935_00790 [Metabacillus litoralis]|uniref:Uncharacterized protein n=1 Tax=Metabacillus litoralis TaxID=152268 RepID=A0A5C6W8J4_9BACI|nr:hypothetical protein [Metabacillus litoralis]TXC92770.1 hypothetical protein FS935_00790 [Metabacillus litoralis]
MYVKIMRFITLYMLAGIGLGLIATYAPSATPIVYWLSIILLGICFGCLLYYYGSKLRKKTK